MSSAADKSDWLRIALTPGVGPAVFHQLIARFGSPRGVLEAGESRLKEIPKLPPPMVRALVETAGGRREAEVTQEMEALSRKGVTLITTEDPAFPPLLRDIPNPPVLLFLKGELLPRDEVALAVVGTRRCDSYGLRVTREITGELASRGVTIVSGLAHGIDAAAHQAAMAAGGRTIAFLPCGFETIYPPEHTSLAEEITQSGAVLTEFTYHVRAIPRCFPPRNRLVSGCALGVLLVQAPAKSGAMITVRLALEQNREVFAVPGRVNEMASEGPHRLIIDGAKLVRHAEDILDELRERLEPRGITPPSRPVTPKPVPRETQDKGERPRQVAESRKADTVPLEELDHPDDRRIVLRLKAGAAHIDRLAGDLDLPVKKLSERLLLLEMKGLVRRLPGMSFDLA
jgi:DNA processing protein